MTCLSLDSESFRVGGRHVDNDKLRVNVHLSPAEESSSGDGRRRMDPHLRLRRARPSCDKTALARCHIGETGMG